MSATQDGSSYGAFGKVRTKAPLIAATKGAIAMVIRSVGASGRRIAHTGLTVWKRGGPAVKRLDSLLQSLGIASGNNEAKGGADIRPLAKAGTALVSLRRDGTRYFDLHHTADDTLDKIDSSQLRQNVAAWAAFVAVAANDADWPENSVIRSKSDPK